MEQWQMTEHWQIRTSGNSGTWEEQWNNVTTKQHQEILPIQNNDILSADNVTKFKTRKLYWKAEHLHKCSNFLKLKLFSLKEGQFFTFQSYYMESSCTAVDMSPNKFTYAEGKYLRKSFRGLGTERFPRFSSSRSPATIGCFFVLSLLVNSLIIMIIARKAIVILIQFFSYLRKQEWLFILGVLD